MKKIKILLLTLVLTLTFGASNVFAGEYYGENPENTNETFIMFYSGLTGANNVNGANSGKFYTLEPGFATLNVSRYEESNINTVCILELRRMIGNDPNQYVSYGSKIVNGIGKFQWRNLDTSSDKYFLVAKGAGANGISRCRPNSYFTVVGNLNNDFVY